MVIGEYINVLTVAGATSGTANNGQHTPRKVLRAVITQELAAQLNWAAQRGEKTGFSGYGHIVFGICGK